MTAGSDTVVVGTNCHSPRARQTLGVGWKSRLDGDYNASA
jgi:hypothetical protein